MNFDAHSVPLLKWSVAHLNFLFVQFEKTEAAGTAHNEITSVRTIRQRNEILAKRLWTNIINRKNSNQTMRNGGGPACLRLRVVMTENEWGLVNPSMKIDEALHQRLSEWAKRNYRDDLAPKDLPDPNILRESFMALDELTKILDLGSDFYPFQRWEMIQIFAMLD